MFEIVVAGSTLLSLLAVAVTEFSLVRTGASRVARPPVPAAPSARVIPMPQRVAQVGEVLRKAA